MPGTVAGREIAGSRRILIAEDNPADVRLMEEALRLVDPAPGIEVVRDGEEALRFFSRPGSSARQPLPDMLFLDYHLPKVDSKSVLEFVRGQDHLQHIAVIVLTTSNAEDLMREAYGLGADCYLSKPSDLDTFFYTIQSAAKYWLNLPLVTSV